MSAPAQKLRLQLPRKHRDALMATVTSSGARVRWRVLKGGRDGAKSHSIAKMLLVRGRAKLERILCVREIQNSIEDSVYKLLCDQIKLLGLEDFYTPYKTKIVGANGTEIVFHGLSGQTATSIKSFEGTTICWVEEAQTVSALSWDILIPTIRADGSEIWCSFNPEMETDAVYARLVTNQPADAIVVHVNFTDNPWRSKALDSDREQMKLSDPEKYEHVYLGATRPAVVGAIYYKEVSALRASGRLGNVPYDPMLKAHVVVDLGRADLMALLIVQRLMSEVRVIRYIEDRMRDIPSYSQELKGLNLNWGKIYLPHDGRAKTLTSQSNPLGASAEEQFTKLGWEVEIVESVDIEQGIRKAREVFPRVAIDKTNAVELANRLGRYKRRVDKTGQAHAPMHNDDSNGADGFRYLCLVESKMANDSTKVVIEDPYAGWRRRA